MKEGQPKRTALLIITICGKRWPRERANTYRPKRCLYSVDVIKAFTISALMKLPLN